MNKYFQIVYHNQIIFALCPHRSWDVWKLDCLKRGFNIQWTSSLPFKYYICKLWVVPVIPDKGGFFLAAYAAQCSGFSQSGTATYRVTLSSILSCMSLCTLIHLNNIWTIFAQYLQNVLQYLRNICTIFAQYLDYICMLFVKYSNNIWSNWNKAI